jgi:hypothetical protein
MQDRHLPIAGQAEHDPALAHPSANMAVDILWPRSACHPRSRPSFPLIGGRDRRVHPYPGHGLMKGWHQPPLGLRIPMRRQRRGGRKRIVAPDGCEIAPTSKPQPVDPRWATDGRASALPEAVPGRVGEAAAEPTLRSVDAAASSTIAVSARESRRRGRPRTEYEAAG